ncbi:hypothetical protein AVEN_103381-1 [Araneus ventricosus]|uniref:Uncharacterized protein n=1 Tax=Araneus ventricosus TaxID=182803 RepID=A0A4Y2PGQ4_ARAVE|nr:hypothetical protein AVEN_103381-1 [Araneus ventricosus]
MSSKRGNSPCFEDDGNDHRFVSLDENLPNDVIGDLLRCTCLRDTPFNCLQLLHRRCLPPHRRCVLPSRPPTLEGRKEKDKTKGEKII